jgi:hypothetical protein
LTTSRTSFVGIKIALNTAFVATKISEFVLYMATITPDCLNTRLLWCLECKKTFSENRGTVFYDSRLPKEKVVSILEHVSEGNGMRKTGSLTKTGHMTVRAPKEGDLSSSAVFGLCNGVQRNPPRDA